MPYEVTVSLIALVLLASAVKIVVLVSTYRLKLRIWEQHQAECRAVQEEVQTRHEAQISEHMRLSASAREPGKGRAE